MTRVGNYTIHKVEPGAWTVADDCGRIVATFGTARAAADHAVALIAAAFNARGK